jgi:hypothetical protein
MTPLLAGIVTTLIIIFVISLLIIIYLACADIEWAQVTLTIIILFILISTLWYGIYTKLIGIG